MILATIDYIWIVIVILISLSLLRSLLSGSSATPNEAFDADRSCVDNSDSEISGGDHYSNDESDIVDCSIGGSITDDCDTGECDIDSGGDSGASASDGCDIGECDIDSGGDSGASASDGGNSGDSD